MLAYPHIAISSEHHWGYQSDKKLRSSRVHSAISWFNTPNDCWLCALQNRLLYFSIIKIYKISKSEFTLEESELKNLRESQTHSVKQNLFQAAGRGSVLMWGKLILVWKMFGLISEASSLLSKVSSLILKLYSFIWKVSNLTEKWHILDVASSRRCLLHFMFLLFVIKAGV